MVGELAVEFVVVKDGQALDVHHRLVTSVERHRAGRCPLERGDVLPFLLLQDKLHAVDEVRHIVELDVPSGQDIRVVAIGSEVS